MNSTETQRLKWLSTLLTQSTKDSTTDTFQLPNPLKEFIAIAVEEYKNGTSTILQMFLMDIVNSGFDISIKKKIYASIPVEGLPQVNGFYRSQTQGLIWIPDMNIVHLKNTIIKYCKNYYASLPTKTLGYKNLTITDIEIVSLMHELQRRELLSNNDTSTVSLTNTVPASVAYTTLYK